MYSTYLVEELRIVEGDHLRVFGHLGQVVTVTNGVWLVGVVLQAPDDGHNVLVLKHNGEQRGLVDEEERTEDVVQVVEALRVLQVFADMEQLQQLGDVALPLHGQSHALPVDWGGDGCGEQVGDFFQFAQFTGRERELDRESTLVQLVRLLSIALLSHVLCGTATLNLQRPDIF